MKEKKKRKKKKMPLKDRITIHIKKTRPLSWKICLPVCFLFFVALIAIAKVEKVEAVSVPDILQTKQGELRITFLGDIEISENIREKANKSSYESLFKGIKGHWDSSEYVVTNVSGPVLKSEVSNYKSTKGRMEDSFYLRPRAVRAMKNAGINVLSFANDSTYNYGRTGIRSTIEVLEKNNVQYIGIESDETKRIHRFLSNTQDTAEEDTSNLPVDPEQSKRKVAMMSINDVVLNNSSIGQNEAGIVNSTISTIFENVYKVSLEAEYLIVYLHYSETENGGIHKQEDLAKLLIDTGADLVIGSSNLSQRIEKYNEGLIVYSLGACVTDEVFSDALDSSVLDFIVDESGSATVYITPARVKDGGLTTNISTAYKKRIQSKLLSKLKKSDYSITDEGIIQITMEN